MPPEDYESVRDELRELLSSIRTPSGERVFERVVRREDLFDSPHVERMPDIVVELSSPSVTLQTGFGFRRFFRERKKTRGVHAPNGLFFAEGPGIRAGRKISSIRIQAGMTPYIRLIPLHGHMRGHCGVAIETSKGWLLHCVDAAYPFYHENKPTPPIKSLPFYRKIPGVSALKRCSYRQVHSSGHFLCRPVSSKHRFFAAHHEVP